MIRMTIDERLLKVVGKVTRARRTTRSAFIREALKAEIRRQRVSDDEVRHAEGYARKPVASGEFDAWLMSRTGAHREPRRRLLVNVQDT